jgi:MFS family permease
MDKTEQSVGPDLSGRQRIISIGAVILATFFLGLSHGIAYPLTSITFERWGSPNWLTGLAAGMPALAALLLLPFAPRLAQRLGFVRAMAGGCLIGLAGFALMPLLQSVEAWLFLRLLMGIGLLFPWFLGETWINVVCADSFRARALALYVVALFSGYGAGPFILGLIPTDGPLPFVFGGAALCMASLPLVLARKISPAMQAEHSGRIFSMFGLAPIAFAGALIAGALEYAYISLLPAVALRHGLGDSTALHLVSAFLIGGVVLQFVFGWLADRYSREHLTLWMLAGFVVLALFSDYAATSPELALAAAFAIGGIACAFYTVGLSLLGERVAPSQLATANAAFLVLYQIGTVSAPPLAGAAMDLWPQHGFIAATIAFAVATFAFIAWQMASAGAQRGSEQGSACVCQ